jgi:hypothetical protein
MFSAGARVARPITSRVPPIGAIDRLPVAAGASPGRLRREVRPNLSVRISLALPLPEHFEEFPLDTRHRLVSNTCSGGGGEATLGASISIRAILVERD